MNLLTAAKALLSGKLNSNPATHCPNCWGHQEYAGDFRSALLKEKIDTNNADEKLGWIQGYAATHLEGIRLKETNDVLSCSKCKLTYTK
ncbi:hypothetical protein [Sanyastnella coralliicola]|uniref:hypothetical protein n=1 Tax=Sanyastnella coralliicola TaxID=3069118 RepID=UPI0027BA64CA|nr:hypothetical protein [Longitalea sp. SCSIO 12813]